MRQENFGLQQNQALRACLAVISSKQTDGRTHKLIDSGRYASYNAYGLMLRQRLDKAPLLIAFLILYPSTNPPHLIGMIEPKNNNFYFEPVQHLEMFNTWTLQNVQVLQVFQIFQVFKRFRMFQKNCKCWTFSSVVSIKHLKHLKVFNIYKCFIISKISERGKTSAEHLKVFNTYKCLLVNSDNLL